MDEIAEDYQIPNYDWFNGRKKSDLIISFGKTLNPLLEGIKKQTRRNWKDTHAAKFVKAFEEKLLIRAFDKDQRYGGKQIGWLSLIEKPYKQKLQDMPKSDLIPEGFPDYNLEEFIKQFFNNPNQEVWVISFNFTENNETTNTI
jgi:hypothetical protein